MFKALELEGREKERESKSITSTCSRQNEEVSVVLGMSTRGVSDRMVDR